LTHKFHGIGSITAKETTKSFCGAVVDIPNLIVIDCQRRNVILAPPLVKYVALSYVWAKSETDLPRENQFQDRLPRRLSRKLPKVIEDAMKVTRALGFRYIWVDKYCIDQTSHGKKQEQIDHMDLVYKGCEIAIVAAALDENTGLPGVGITRRTPQPVVSFRNIRVISTMPHPQHEIKKKCGDTTSMDIARISPRP
jgi:hypothetical protein